MRGLAIIILIVVFFWLVWPALSRWLKRKAMERAEDYMRKSMGMPPRDKKSRKKNAENSDAGYTYYQRTRRKPYTSNPNEPLIPKEYAEDVEYVETKDYSESESRLRDGRGFETYHESQISDAEFTEIKKPRTK